MTIGDRVRKLRISKGWTQSELAKKMGYKSKSSIAHIENGRDIPRSMVVTLADILDTSPSYLMGWEEELDISETSLTVLPEKIKEARKKAGLSQKELAEKLDMNLRTYGSYERGERDVSTAVLLKICKTLNISSDYLLGRDEKPIESNIRSILPQENIRMIPVYDSVSAGFGSYADSTVKEYMPLYIESDEEAENTMCINVDGDSMEPKIEDGDTIQVLRQSTCDNGDIAVILIDREEGVVKKVQFDNNSTTLISFNTDYPPRVFVGEEQNRLMIQGVVKAIIKRL